MEYTRWLFCIAHNFPEVARKIQEDLTVLTLIFKARQFWDMYISSLLCGSILPVKFVVTRPAQ